MTNSNDYEAARDALNWFYYMLDDCAADDDALADRWDTMSAYNAISAIITTAIAKERGWQPIDSAPKYDKMFLCRYKNNPRVTFEALIFRDRESWEIPQEYDVLQNMTIDEPIDDWTKVEWSPLPTPPKESE